MVSLNAQSERDCGSHRAPTFVTERVVAGGIVVLYLRQPAVKSFLACLGIAMDNIDPVRHCPHKAFNVSMSYGSAPGWSCAHLFDVGWGVRSVGFFEKAQRARAVDLPVP